MNSFCGIVQNKRLVVWLFFKDFMLLWQYFSHIATWKEIPNLWNRSGKTSAGTPDPLLCIPELNHSTTTPPCKIRENSLSFDNVIHVKHLWPSPLCCVTFDLAPCRSWLHLSISLSSLWFCCRSFLLASFRYRISPDSAFPPLSINCTLSWRSILLWG